MIEPPVRTILRKHPNVRFVIIGFTQARELIFENIPDDKIVTFPWSDVYTYRAFLASLDIVIAPSYPVKFNAGKSDIRCMEAWLAAKAPVVGSPTTYGETILEARGGLVANKTKDWIVAMERLILNPELRSVMGQSGHDYVVAQRTYDLNIHLWEAAYATLLEEG